MMRVDFLPHKHENDACEFKSHILKYKSLNSVLYVFCSIYLFIRQAKKKNRMQNFMLQTSAELWPSMLTISSFQR